MLFKTYNSKVLFFCTAFKKLKCHNEYATLHHWKKLRIINNKIMPKTRTIPDELREIRVKAKNALVGKPPIPPSEMYLCVLGNGASSSCRAVFLVTDQGRYLFNCGEGTQRLSHEYRLKLSKLDHLFFTYKSWDNFGGLLGLSLTVQDIGVPEINIHGPPGIDMLFENSQSFVLAKDIKIVMKNFKEPFVDNCMEVNYIPIFPENHKMEMKHSPASSASSEDELEKHDNVSDRRAKKIRSSREKLPDMVMCYACKGHSKPGHLLIEKCVELGVPPGPLLGDLKNGKDITLSSGKIVHSKDVVSEEQPCPAFLVVECPSVAFLNSFVKEEKFKKYQSSSPSPCDIASVVVHFTPSDVLKNQIYQEWMTKFPDSTHHLLINNDNSSLGSIGIHRVQYKLNLLHPRIFSQLLEQEGKESLGSNCSISKVIQTKTLDRYYLRPHKGLDRSNVVSLQPEEFVEEALNTPQFQENLKNLQNNIEKEKKICDEILGLYPEVIFLGTGSSIPSKVRNVSAILVNTCKDEYLLMDCGEGTCGQLTRLYKSMTTDILLHTNCVFISHMHADHHLGLIQFLKRRQAAFERHDLEYDPLILIGPHMLHLWLTEYHKSFEPISSLYKFISCFSLWNEMPENENLIIFKTNNNIQVHTVPVNHCPDAYGVILTDATSNWKLVYSGDTIPCQNLVDAGKNCSLLIHEATMEDELADEAAFKKHCTTSEAIKVGEEMNAKYTILTHFSQRYAKVPLFNENFHNHVGCAFDNMKVRPRDLYVLPLLIPALKCLFAENVEELIIKGNKRRRKIELLKNISESIAI
ncbi:ribonuclease Z, mitochondrial-like [Uloborus diversus]|uniref:ribonuclease Z, mitochondrial-like n=1 Tax=Uloborus diversus TaxID=327109 RepID=UPI002409F445|nr:ribonuclease Z, mitochondrial-like [Uloborus diversus]